MDHCYYCKKRIWPWQSRYPYIKSRDAHTKCDLVAIKKATQMLVEKGQMSTTVKRYIDVVREAKSYV